MLLWSELVLNTLQGAVDTTQTGIVLKITNHRTKPQHASGYIKNSLKRDLFLRQGRGKMTFWALALYCQKQQNFQRYLIIWRHDRPAWVSAWRPNAWFLAGRHLVEAGVLAVLEPRARGPSCGAGARCRPVGLAAALLLLLRLLRRCLRLLLRCCLLLMLILLLLILREEATQHRHPLWATCVSVLELPTPVSLRGTQTCLPCKAECWEKFALRKDLHTLWGSPTFAFLMKQAGLKLERQFSASYR